MKASKKVIRAIYDENTITVYQAFNKDMANAAISAQTFVSPPFKKDRMTWIKPSFLWMMYRSGWATKENQEHILAIQIKRDGFESALDNACLSHSEDSIYGSFDNWKKLLSESSVRLQWDPEKDIFLKSLNYKSVQIGLSGWAVEKYISEWIMQIRDITQSCKEIHQLILVGDVDRANEIIPLERIYPLPRNIADKIGASQYPFIF